MRGAFASLIFIMTYYTPTMRRCKQVILQARAQQKSNPEVEVAFLVLFSWERVLWFVYLPTIGGLRIRSGRWRSHC